MPIATTIHLFGTSGDDYYQYTGTESLHLEGDDGNDYLIGGDLNDYIDGGNDNDTLYGGAGNDTLFGKYEHPPYSPISDGSNYLYGGSGNDSLNGSRGNDYLYGGNGNDILVDYTNGNDYLNGGLGADFMNGGNGNDTYIVNAPGDSIDEDYFTYGGIDTVYSSVSYSMYSASGVENIYLTGTSAISGWGNPNNNFISGNSANNLLDGYGGYDTLVGGEGNDTLVGFVYDWYTDALSGGIGADTFTIGGLEVHSSGNGYAVINDFQRQEGDKFQVFGSINDYSLDKSQNFTGTTALDTGIYYQGDLIAVVEGTRRVSLSLDFIYPNL